MSAGNPKNLLINPGRLCIGPTDLSAAFPHGGTALGLVRDVEFRVQPSARLITSEEWGGIPYEAVRGGDRAILAVVLREWNADAIAAIFPDTSTGGTTARPVAAGRVATDGRRAGTRPDPAVLLFSPNSPDRHPAVLFHRALPLLEETAQMRLHLSEEVGIAAAWHALPDGSGNAWRVGYIRDLSL